MTGHERRARGDGQRARARLDDGYRESSHLRRHGSVAARWMRRLELHQAGAEELDGARRHELTRGGIGARRDRADGGSPSCRSPRSRIVMSTEPDPCCVIRIAPTAPASRARNSSGSVGSPSATITTSRPIDSSSSRNRTLRGSLPGSISSTRETALSARETPAQSAGPARSDNPTRATPRRKGRCYRTSERARSACGPSG